MPDLFRRAVVSLISIAAFLCVLFFAFNPTFQFFVAAIIAALAGVATWEYAQFVKAKGGWRITPILVGLTMIVTFSFFIRAQYPVLNSLPILLFFIGFLVLFALHFKENNGAIVDLAVSSFGLLYIAVPMGMTLGILYLPQVDGRWWLAYLVVVTKITDVGAYFAGNLWGKRKLAPTISPKKTVEGALFGLLCASAASVIFCIGSDHMGPFHIGITESIFLGLLLGVVGQFGDLSESLLKRDANMKDSNNLPGLGGILDALDSILFNATIIFIYLNFVKL